MRFSDFDLLSTDYFVAVLKYLPNTENLQTGHVGFVFVNECETVSWVARSLFYVEMSIICHHWSSSVDILNVVRDSGSPSLVEICPIMKILAWKQLSLTATVATQTRPANHVNVDWIAAGQRSATPVIDMPRNLAYQLTWYFSCLQFSDTNSIRQRNGSCGEIFFKLAKRCNCSIVGRTRQAAADVATWRLKTKAFYGINNDQWSLRHHRGSCADIRHVAPAANRFPHLLYAPLPPTTACLLGVNSSWNGSMIRLTMMTAICLIAANTASNNSSNSTCKLRDISCQDTWNVANFLPVISVHSQLYCSDANI